MIEHVQRFNIRTIALFAALGLASCALAPQALSPAQVVENAGRPETDKARDDDRKPAEMLAFANVRPGQTIVDYMPGKGYFTRLLSIAVGKRGRVFAVTPQLYVDRQKGKPLASITGEPGRTNVHDTVAVGARFGLPVKVDLVWTAQNYHDIHNWAGIDGTNNLNKAAFDALKPGGIYIVLDHSGPAGLDAAGMTKLHRIDKQLVKAEVTEAGFVLDASSDVLRNAADPRTAPVFDPSIRGKTDQFVLRFRKPWA